MPDAAVAEPTWRAVELSEPLDLGRSCAGLTRHGDDLLDRWVGEVMVRSAPAPVAVRPVAGTTAAVEVLAPTGVEPAEVVRAFIGGNASALRDLLAVDPVLAAAAATRPGLRPLLWPDLLGALVRAVSAQQVTLSFAATVRRRLAERYGTKQTIDAYEVVRLDATRLAEAAVEDLRELQLTWRKAEYLVGIARAVADGSLELERLRESSDDEVRATVTAVRGLGNWSADWLLARTLGRPVVVAGDLAVRKAVGLAYLGGRMPSEAEVLKVTEHWGTAALDAQNLLLTALADGDLGRMARAPRAITAPVR